MTDVWTRLANLEAYVGELERRVVEAERMNENVMRLGKVMKTDPQNGLVTISWGKDENEQWVEGPDIPWTTRAGKIRIWNPPSVGEQVVVFSMGGEIGAMSLGMGGAFSNQFKQNHNKDGEFRMSIGKTDILVTEGGITLKGDKITIITKQLDQKADKINQDKKGPEEETPDPILPPLSYPTEAPPGLQGEVPTS